MSNVIDSAWYGSPPNKEFIGRCHWQRPAQYSDTRCYIEIFHLDSTLDCLFSIRVLQKDAQLVIYTRIFFFFFSIYYVYNSEFYYIQFNYSGMMLYLFILFFC